MRITFDPAAGAAYVYLAPQIAKGGVKRCVPLMLDEGDLVLDFDEAGKLLGIEILNASMLPDSVLKAAELPPVEVLSK